MQDARPLWEQARQLGRAAFIARHARWFLLKHANTGSATEAARFEYHTVAVRTDELEAGDPYPGEWRVVEVGKRPGNPFPERISVGRANNCDVVLRFPFVSKLHAHFVDGDGAALKLADHRSANGTTVAGKPLPAGDALAVHSGDWIAFGPLRLQLLDTSDLYDALMRAYPDA
ncbi:MAG: FHA domain-containing protein [Deltaproteobacteria bacterium]|nr:FHA domain-containing protein [Deltaproteobacteria bacterium]